MIATLSLVAALLFRPEQHLPAPLTDPLSSNPYVSSLVTAVDDGYVVVFHTRDATFVQALDKEGTRLRDAATLLDLGPDVRDAAVGSNGRNALVVFNTNGGLVAQVISPKGIPAGARHIVGEDVSIQVDGLALIRIGGRHLLLRGNSAIGTRGQFLGNDGAPDGDSFPISSDQYFVAASNGTTAFITTKSGGSLTDAKTFLILPGGGVQQTATVSQTWFPMKTTWDGHSYLLALWTGAVTSVPTLLTFSSTGTLVGTRALDLPPNSSIFDLIGNGNGAALIVSHYVFHSNGDLTVMDLGPGGDVSTGPRTIQPGFTTYSDALFDGDHYLFLERGAPILTDLQTRFDAGSAIAFEAAYDQIVRVASGPNMSYVCWGESGDIRVARVRDGAFLGDSIVVIAGAPGDLSHAIAADEDRALCVARNDAGRLIGRFVDRDATLSQPFELPAAYTSVTDALRVGSHWVVIAYGSGGNTAVSLDESGRIVEEVPLAPFSYSVAVTGNGMLILSNDATSGDLVLTLADGHGHALRSLTIGNQRFPEALSLAVDGDRAVAVWQSFSPRVLHSVAVDMAPMTIAAVHDVPSPLYGNGFRIAWTGRSFLLLDSYSQFVTFSRDGNAGVFGDVPSPIPGWYPDIARTPDGALIAYVRSGADVGAGDVPRIFLRAVTEIAPRSRAVEH